MRLHRVAIDELPVYLAATVHRHICPNCGVEYADYSPRHQDGTLRLCGSSPSVCRAKPKQQEKDEA